MIDDTLSPFDLPIVARKKVTAAFDGGRITSNGGVMLLAQAERRLGNADPLARAILDERHASRSSIRFPISCAPASSPSPVAMKTPTTWTGYGWRLRDFFAVFAD
jgi:hypothetical protein